MTNHTVTPDAATVYRIEAHGTILRQSVIATPEDPYGTTARVHKGDGAYWFRWLDDGVDEWQMFLTETDAVAAYEAAVRDTYPLTDTGTGAPTWTASDVDGVPTTDAP